MPHTHTHHTQTHMYTYHTDTYIHTPHVHTYHTDIRAPHTHIYTHITHTHHTNTHAPHTHTSHTAHRYTSHTPHKHTHSTQTYYTYHIHTFTHTLTYTEFSSQDPMTLHQEEMALCHSYVVETTSNPALKRWTQENEQFSIILCYTCLRVQMSEL